MKPSEITKLRMVLRLNKSEFAKKLGVGLRTIHRWEAGQSEPSPVMVKILKAVR